MAVYLRFDTRRIAVFRARMRLNRSNLRRSAHSRKDPIANTPYCDYCNTNGHGDIDETPEHLLLKCPHPTLVAARTTNAVVWSTEALLGDVSKWPSPLVGQHVLRRTANYLTAILNSRGGFL